MPLDHHKELTPVLYGNHGVKLLPTAVVTEENVRLFPLHWHERMELLLVTKGSLALRAGNEDCLVQAGQLAIITPGLLHTGQSGENGVSYETIMFDLSNFITSAGASARFLTPLHNQQLLFDHITDNAAVIGAVNELLTLLHAQQEAVALQVIGKVYDLLGLLFLHVRWWRVDLPYKGKLNEVLKYMEQHSCENITSSSISRKYNYDEAYFCRKFKAVTGLPPMKYIKILRLEKAQRMLEETDQSIAQIAQGCGFCDSDYFGRCFKSHFGVSPTAYAAKHRT